MSDSGLSMKLNQKSIVVVISVVVPLLVAFLIFTPQKLALGQWVQSLPTLNAVFNSSTSFFLLLALVMVKRGNIELHRTFMTTGLILGALFLVSYVIYHSSSPSVKFGDINGDGTLSAQELAAVGAQRGIYVFVLLSHILLSIVVLPLVLFAFYFAWSNKIDRHKKLVKWTFPIWFYVSITGVIVYLMISPYYPWN